MQNVLRVASLSTKCLKLNIICRAQITLQMNHSVTGGN